MLDEMKETGRSKHSPTVVKKRSSSGCLNIEKKVTDSGFSDSASRKLFNSSKGKKRRVVESDSEYSDSSSETIHRRVYKFHNGATVHKGAYLEGREFKTEKRTTNGLDVFEFDEYDGFDDKMIRKDANEGSYQWNLHRQRANQIGAETMVGTNSHMIDGGIGKKLRRCTLLVRSSEKGLNSENDGHAQFSGKRTLLSWLIDSGVVQMGEHVEYVNHETKKIMQKGWITADGIHCCCCSKIITVLQFELHAGCKLSQPFPNIFLESGKSLLQCQIDAWNKQGELERNGFNAIDVDGDDPNDDTCGLCGDGGDLICCDGCPSTFHQSCLDIQMLPEGDWHCPNCCCKYCQIASGNTIEVGCKSEASLLTCCFCQKKYHESCVTGIYVKLTGANYMNLTFCEQKCHELYSQLQKLLGVKHELDSGFSWSLIHRSDLSTDASSLIFSQRVESNSMLAIAMSIMDECFLPFIDRRSQTNLIRSVVFNCGSNVSRLNYGAFYTAVLERGDEMLCVASIRIHGTQLAEMPFIGTRHIYRRQGMCRRLLSAIESALSSLDVEKLIIPAVAERTHTWSDVFGFHPLEESHKQELKSLNMFAFPGTDMLQKPLVNETMAKAGGNESETPCKSISLNNTVSLNSNSSCEHELQSPGMEYHSMDSRG